MNKNLIYKGVACTLLGATLLGGIALAPINPPAEAATKSKQICSHTKITNDFTTTTKGNSKKIKGQIFIESKKGKNQHKHLLCMTSELSKNAGRWSGRAFESSTTLTKETSLFVVKSEATGVIYADLNAGSAKGSLKIHSKTNLSKKIKITDKTYKTYPKLRHSKVYSRHQLKHLRQRHIPWQGAMGRSSSGWHTDRRVQG